jgi:thymidylate kinase
MNNNMNDLARFETNMNNSSYLEYDEDNDFLEWYMIEGAERINELSRQLRTFLNYKKSVIQSRFSKSGKFDRISKSDLLTKLKKIADEYTTFLREFKEKSELIYNHQNLLMVSNKVQQILKT